MSDEILRVRDLTVDFGGRRRQRGHTVRAVNHVSLSVRRGETLGIVGESGSGKSTLARAILRLVPIETGNVELDGARLDDVSGKQLRAARRHVQMVFQDPYSSLDPSTSVGSSVAEPLRVHTDLDRRERTARVRELFDLVGLRPELMTRYPDEFSGGQRQRIAIARALAAEPSLLICDEAVSALDVSTQNQVLNLLADLQQELGLAMLFITHDMSVVRHVAHRVAVMYFGEVVETASTDTLFAAPQHPYTLTLLASVPWVGEPPIRLDATSTVLAGELPDPTNPPVGCPFATRCAHAVDICVQQRPDFVETPQGHGVKCFVAAERLGAGAHAGASPTVEQKEIPS